MPGENKFNKEEFLKDIHSIPYWVETGEDLLKFCKHLQYRLHQNKVIDLWYRINIKLTNDQKIEIYKIIEDCDEAYNNYTRELQSFKDSFRMTVCKEKE